MKLHQRLWVAAMAKTLPLRQKLANDLLSGIHLNTDMSFGENSITLQNDKIAFSATATPSAEGQLAYNLDEHRLKLHDGTASRALAHENMVLALTGGTMSGNVAMGTNKITGLGNGTAGSQDAATVAQMEAHVGNLIAQKVDCGYPGEGLIGHGNESEINALTPVIGNVIVSEASFTPAEGTSDALAAGDVAEFDGTSWKKIVSNSGGFVPAGTRLLVSTASAFIVGGNLADGTDEGKIAYFDGTSLAQASFTTPSDGVIVAVKGEGALSENAVLAFDGAVPTGAWRATAASGVAHNSLTGLTSGDDHTQYAKISGRSGGQTLTGGTASGDDLTFSSTSNGTKGDIVIGQTGDTVKSGVAWSFTADVEVKPATDGQVSLGTSSLAFKQVYADLVVQNDALYRGRGKRLRLQETDYGLRMLDQTDLTDDDRDDTTGKAYRMLRVPENVGPVRRLALRALGVC